MTQTTVTSISINENLCKPCGVCIAICPRKVLASDADGRVQVLQLEACTSCLMCELICPELAISVHSSRR